MSAAQVDPHDKMRARDVNKVARGQQAPRPPHQYGTVSPPPPPSSTHTASDTNNKEGKSDISENGAELAESSDYKTRHCYAKYVEYHRCIQQKGETAPECQKLDTYFRSSCPSEWITEWDKEREQGKFPAQV